MLQMRSKRLLTPGRIRGREQQHAAAMFPGGRTPDKPGDHSVWCDLVLIERGCYPLLARGVVVVLTEDKVFLRVAATAFTFTVHLQDVVLVRHVVPKDVVELHVCLPDASRTASQQPTDHFEQNYPGFSSSSSSPTTAAQRLYRLTLTDHDTLLCARLFRTFVDLLPLPSQQQQQRAVAVETFADDAVAAYLVEQPCSILPLDLLDCAGLREIEWVEDAWATPTAAAAATSATSVHHVAGPSTPCAPPHPYNEPARNAVVTDGSAAALLAHEASTGHLRTIYVAPSPSFWRLARHASTSHPQEGRLKWSTARGQTSLPQPEVQRILQGGPLPADVAWPFSSPASLSSSSSSSFVHPQAHWEPALASPSPASSQPAQASFHSPSQKPRPTRRSTQETVAMSSRKSSLMADMCGLRPLVAPASAPSSHTSQNTDRTLTVQYGPVVSG